MISNNKLNASFLNQQKLSWNNGALIIISLLMAAILFASFYEPKWVHSGAFEKSKPSSEDSPKSVSTQIAVNLRELITSATRKSRQSGALQSLAIQPEILKANSVEVNPSLLSCLTSFNSPSSQVFNL
jgi:uncharacterized membrane protein affecting hemolysin expression